MSQINHQQGSIVVLLLVLLALMALTPIVRGGGMKDPVAKVQQKNIASLAQAREALLNYLLIGDPANLNWTALQNNAVLPHARFPCPDIDGNGLIDAVDTAGCGAQGISALGLFPWRTLGTPQLSDGSGNCLWYAVSGRHKLHNPMDSINGDDNGSFAIYDAQFQLVALNVVAVVIAPGAALGGQIQGTGACPPLGAANQYLEVVNDPSGSGAFINHADLATGGKVAASFVTFNPSDAPALTGTMNDQIAWITAEEYALAATRHVAEMQKAAWTPVLKAFHTATTDPDFPSLHIYPPPAAEPGGRCGRRDLITSGFLPMICTLQDWWEGWGWWAEREPSCGTYYSGEYWAQFHHWVPGYWTGGYWTAEGWYNGDWVPGYWYWDYDGIANERARLNCDRWDMLTIWINNHQQSLGPLPRITTALANDGWHNQTLYTIDGATLDGVSQAAPLILLRSRPLSGALPMQTCSTGPTVIQTVSKVSGCVEAPNRAAINGTRQFSSPNPRTSNDLLRVMK